MKKNQAQDRAKSFFWGCGMFNNFSEEDQHFVFSEKEVQSCINNFVELRVCNGCKYLAESDKDVSWCKFHEAILKSEIVDGFKKFIRLKACE